MHGECAEGILDLLPRLALNVMQLNQQLGAQVRELNGGLELLELCAESWTEYLVHPSIRVLVR